MLKKILIKMECYTLISLSFNITYFFTKTSDSAWNIFKVSSREEGEKIENMEPYKDFNQVQLYKELSHASLGWNHAWWQNDA